MTDSTKGTANLDLLEKLPLETASKISLQGGGVLLLVAIAGVHQMNVDPKWQIDSWLIFSLLVGAVLLGLAGALARMYDAKLRVQLALKLIDKSADAEAAKKYFEIVKMVTDGESLVRGIRATAILNGGNVPASTASSNGGNVPASTASSNGDSATGGQVQ